MADFCKITSVSSLPLNISQNLAPDMSSSQKSTGKSGIRRPRKAPPVTNVINPKPVTYQVDDISEFKLDPRAKGSFMFVNWTVLRHVIKSKKVKFICSEEATKFCEIFTLCTVVKSKVKISQNFVAFSEHMNFTFFDLMT